MLTVNTNEWNKAVKAVSAIYNKKVYNPIVNNAVLEWDGKLLTLSATNLSESIRVTLPINVSSDWRYRPFSVAIDKKRLSKLVGKKNETVSFQLGLDNFLDVSIGNVTQSVETSSTEDYPPFPETQCHLVSLYKTGKQFIDKISQVVCACSDERARYQLGCVHIENDRLVATDGRRLHMSFHGMGELFHSQDTGISLHMNSANTLIKLNKLYDIASSELKMDSRMKRLSMETADFIYASTVCEENFPPYKPLFTDPDCPTSRMIHVCTVNSKSLLDILKAQEPTLNERSRLTEFYFTEGMFLVKTFREGKEIFSSPVESVPGDCKDFTTCYNSHFVQDAIKSSDSEFIEFYVMREHSCPLLISSSNHSFFSMVMPMTIREEGYRPEEVELEGITFTKSDIGNYCYSDENGNWTFSDSKGFWECYFFPESYNEKTIIVTGQTIVQCIAQVFSQIPDLDSTLSEYLPIAA